MIQTVLKTLESLQVQFIDRVANVPVMAQRQVSSARRHQNTVLVSHAQLVDKMVDVPHMMKRQASAAEVTQKPGQ